MEEKIPVATTVIAIKKIFFFIAILFIPMHLQSQFSRLLQYTVKDGLPSSTVYAVTQDSLGYIWLGTDAGLVRFDGARFKIFTTQDGLPDNEVLGLLTDKVVNRMWVITYSKQACYYRSGHFFNPQNEKSLTSVTCDFGEFVGGNCESDFGVFLYNGFSIYACAKGRINKSKIKAEGALQVNQWKDGTQDIIFRVGVARHICDSLVYYRGQSLDSINESGKWISNNLILYRHGGFDLYRHGIDGYSLTASIRVDEANAVSKIILSGSKYFFCFSGSAIYEIDTSLSGLPKRVWSGGVNDIFADKDSNIWIATNDAGVYITNNKEPLSYSAANGLMHENITTLFIQPDGVLYLGNSYGEIFYLKDKILERLDVDIGKERVRGIISLKNDVYIINSLAIARFNKVSKRIEVIPHISGGPKSIMKLHDSTKILVGLLGSIVEFNLKTGTHREIPFHKRIIDMVQHPDGRILCGSLDGIYQLISDSLVHIKSNDARLQRRITSMCLAKDNILWIGTPSDGILAYDRDKVVGQINATRYTSYHGAICRKIVSSKLNEIWVATNSGVDRIRYHLDDSLVVDNITPLNTVDGLMSDDVNDIIISDSLIYVASSRGLTILNGRELVSPLDASIYINSVRVNDMDSLIRDEYLLRYWQNNLSIEYTGILLPSARYLRYQYRLLGTGDDRWTTTSNNSIDFRSLSAGNYIFQVAVLDKFGNRSKKYAEVKFRIKTPFYKTIWFWAIVFIFTFVLGYYLIKSRFKRRQLINNKIIDLEQQALKAQMNPHFIFNCLTAIQHFVNKEDVYSANMYLSNFAKLIRKTLDLSGEQYITLAKEISYLENYIQLEKMRFQEQFNYVIKADPDVDPFTVSIPPMLLQPIIENAIRHGLRYKDNNEGLLKIDFRRDGNSLICQIDDNGIGIKRSRELKSASHVEYQSKGMKLTESRIAAINMISEKKINMEVKDKYDRYGNAVGTLVIIKFEQ